MRIDLLKEKAQEKKRGRFCCCCSQSSSWIRNLTFELCREEQNLLELKWIDINTINNITLYRSGNSYVQVTPRFRPFPVLNNPKDQFTFSHTNISVYKIHIICIPLNVDNISLPVALLYFFFFSNLTNTKIPNRKLHYMPFIFACLLGLT